jgi:NTP pyrophosphatase (non-canonical NTP hydrolase)
MTEQNFTDHPIAVLQRAVDQSVMRTGGYWPEDDIFTHLVEEVGEVGRSRRKTRPRPEHELPSELADTLFTLLAYANRRGIDLAPEFERCLVKIDPVSITVEVQQPCADGSVYLLCSTRNVNAGIDFADRALSKRGVLVDGELYHVTRVQFMGDVAHPARKHYRIPDCWSLYVRKAPPRQGPRPRSQSVGPCRRRPYKLLKRVRSHR